MINEETKRNCNTCRHGMPFATCDILDNNEEYKSLPEGIRDIQKKYEWKEKFVCGKYRCRYIEYPIEVSGINKDTEMRTVGADRIGSFVRVRPCGDDKTYLGIYLGDLPLDITVSHNYESKVLNIGYMTNPAIFVFDLNRIVYGAESWWGTVENEDDLREISDSTIENIWYVRALKMMEGDGKEQ